MKRFLEIVAVAVIAILAAQPALAGLTCGMLRVPVDPKAAASGLAMSPLRTDCQPARDVAGTGCLQECCKNGFPQGVVRNSSEPKPKTHGALVTTAVPQVAPSAQKTHPAATTVAIVAADPPRYILLRVFRI